MSGAILCILLTWFNFDGPGTTAIPLLQVEQSIRAAALGGAHVGRADDPGALQSNPAGLGLVRRHHFTLAHNEWPDETRDEFLQGTFAGRSGAFAVGLFYSGEPGIEFWTRKNTRRDTFSTWTAMLSLGYGARFADRWRVGASAKGVYNSLFTLAGYGGALDLGLGYRLLEQLELGLAGRNLGYVFYEDRRYNLPSEAVIGAAWTPGDFNLGTDLALPFGCPMILRAGAEYRPTDVIALRLGYRTGPVDLSGLGWQAGLSGGFGLMLGPILLDYAVLPYAALGTTHRIGLDFSFRQHGSGRLLIQTAAGPGMEPKRAEFAFDGIHIGTGQADRHGRYELTGLLPGRLIIRTSLPGYQPRSDTIDILGDQRQFATIELRLMAYGSIWLTVADAGTMWPVGGMVSYSGPVYGEQDIPAVAGSTVIRNLPVGGYVLTVSDPDGRYRPETCTLQVTPGAVVEHRFLLSR